MRYIELTKKQKDILEALVRFKKLKKAARKLHISYASAKQRLYRVRRNYKEATLFLQEWEKRRYDDIFAKLPSCQNCCFANLKKKKCQKEGVLIATEGVDMPCAFWQPKKEKNMKSLVIK